MSGLQDKHWKHPAIKILARCLRGERLWQTISASLLLLISTWLVWWALPHWSGLMALIPLILSTWWILRLAPWRPLRNQQLFTILRESPEQIVWVYGLVNQMSPYGFRFMKQGILYFKLRDGSEISLSVPGERIKLISRFLNRVLPHALFGYTAERQWAWEKNPAEMNSI
ncbi:MAG: hypothetical protein GYB31_10100 [Bacteroidetes bacterium]|nr:hypothetical protein [Bacteroidota bacterium]